MTTQGELLSAALAGRRIDEHDVAWICERLSEDGRLDLADVKLLVELYRVAFYPLKDISFISDEYNKFELEGSLLADTTKPYDAVLGQFGRIVQL